MNTMNKALTLEGITVPPEDFLGVRFDPLDMEATLSACASVSAAAPFRYLVTPNVDHVVRLEKEPEIYGPLYAGAWLSVCDSRILQLLAGKSGLDLPVVPGSDLTKALFDSIIQKDEPVNVIGGDETVVAKVRELYGLTRLNQHIAPMGLRSNPEAVKTCADFIAAHPARFTFICVGSPQQEMVARAAMATKAKGLGLCVGASLDFIAGTQKRAPEWMQKRRLEWLYRLVSQPRRLWKRYLVDGPRIFAIWLKWRKARKL